MRNNARTLYQNYSELSGAVGSLGENAHEKYEGILTVGAAIQKTKRLHTANKVNGIREAMLSLSADRPTQAYMAVAALDEHLDSPLMRRSDKQALRAKLLDVRNEAVRHYQLNEAKLESSFASYTLFEKPSANRSLRVQKVARKELYSEVKEHTAAHPQSFDSYNERVSPMDAADARITKALDYVASRPSRQKAIVQTEDPVIAVLTSQTRESLEERIAPTEQTQRGISRLLRPVARIAAGIVLAGTTLALQSSCVLYQPQERTYATQNGAGDRLGIGMLVHAKMLEEMRESNAPFGVASKAPANPIAAAVVKEPTVTYESVKTTTPSPVASVTEHTPSPFELEVADSGSSLVPDKETIARYEAEEARVHEQRMEQGRNELVGRMYEGIRSGFAKIENALRGLDAKVASMIPSVPVVSARIYEAPAVTNVPENAPVTTTHVASKPECGIISVAREYGMLNETVESAPAPVRRPFVNGVGDALGQAIYAAAKHRASEPKTESVRPAPVKPSSSHSPTPVRSSDYTNWQHEPSHLKVVTLRNGTKAFIEVGNSGRLAGTHYTGSNTGQDSTQSMTSPQGQFTQGQLKQMWESGKKHIEGQGIVTLALDGTYLIRSPEEMRAMNDRMVQRMKERREASREKILTNSTGN